SEQRFVQIEPSTPGMASIWANIDAVDAAALDQRLDAVANTVCEQDPRSHEQRRADAIGPLARLEAHLVCRCGREECPAAQNRAAADAAVVHVLAQSSTVDGGSDAPGYLPGHGILPAESVRNVATHAKIKPVRLPAEPTEPAEAAEPGYRPSAALSEFIRWRDLTCRFPGCDAPAERCDVDHTTPWPAGPTHPSNTKLYCRAHHLIKTFCPGWSDRQYPDGTVEVTTPTGHTYTTEPHGGALFEDLATPTGNLNLTDPPPAPGPNRSAKMPKRSRTREQDRQDRITEERRLRAEFNNDLAHERAYQAWLAEEYGPPPPF
ncbi:HNH endonuclease signature motif containing protein, partial [Mycolicibacterium fortuitum]|uniref:HNH endonuclease signature motif containing protein n=1 Tax=Mycolicibacterium fortuitum TaxID=1766 RepID=UPI000B302AA8